MKKMDIQANQETWIHWEDIQGVQSYVDYEL